MSPCHSCRYSLVFPQTLENKPMQQTRERLASYKRRSNIFGVHLVRMVYLAKINDSNNFTFLFLIHKSKQKFCLLFSSFFVVVLRFTLLQASSLVWFAAEELTLEHQYMGGAHQPQGRSRSKQAGGSPSTWVKGTMAPSFTQRLHFLDPSGLGYTKILNCLGLPLAKQHFKMFPCYY